MSGGDAWYVVLISEFFNFRSCLFAQGHCNNETDLGQGREIAVVCSQHCG